MDSIFYPDDQTCFVCIEIDPSKIAELHGYFELSESLGNVHTIDFKDLEDSLVCIITTPSVLEACLNMLNSIKTNLGWKYPEVNSINNERILAYFNKENNA